jgi:hypothetical protein
MGNDFALGFEAISNKHIDSALFFAEVAMELEKKFPMELDYQERQNRLASEKMAEDTLLIRHFAYVTGSVFATVAFLEAKINEAFLEADRRAKGESVRDGLLEKLASDTIESMGRAWSYGIKKSGDDGIELDNGSKELKRYPNLINYLELRNRRSYNNNVERNWSILNKYQLALYLASNPLQLKPFDNSSIVWKEVELLLRLRNRLTHYKPEWITYHFSDQSYNAETEETRSLMNELRDRRCRNKLYPPEPEPTQLNLGAAIEALFTTLLAANCAIRAIQHSLKFVREFDRRMPIESDKRFIESRLEELKRPVYSS